MQNIALPNFHLEQVLVLHQSNLRKTYVVSRQWKKVTLSAAKTRIIEYFNQVIRSIDSAKYSKEIKEIIAIQQSTLLFKSLSHGLQGLFYMKERLLDQFKKMEQQDLIHLNTALKKRAIQNHFTNWH